MEVIYVPRRLVEEAKRKGLDVNEVVLNALIEALNLDPRDKTIARLELAEKFLEEAEKYMAKKDIVQASEKLYKAVEECIKALAEHLNIPQLEEVKKRGRWTTWLLGMASTDLSRKLGEEKIRSVWAIAYEVHVWGFHEAKYRIEDIETVLPLAKWLLEYAKKIIKGG